MSENANNEKKPLEIEIVNVLRVPYFDPANPDAQRFMVVFKYDNITDSVTVDKSVLDNEEELKKEIKKAIEERTIHIGRRIVID